MKSLKSIALVSCASFLLFSCQKEAIKQHDLILSSEGLQGAANRAPLFQVATDNAKPIHGSYIVVFKDDIVSVDDEISRISRGFGVKAKFSYKYSIKGFAAEIPTQALDALRNNPNISYIEEDQIATAVATTQDPTPSWGLDRIDQTTKVGSIKAFTYTSTGSGVKAYIFDTGINFDHADFSSRISQNKFDAFNGGNGGSAQDFNGHGTHCAGTVGGSTYGIAKAVTLVPVRVLDAAGSGSYSGIIAGIDWAISNHGSEPAVGNMSLGGGASTSMDNAVRNAIADGIVMCIAAGNSSRDAKNFSPARVKEAITVGATDVNDRLASYSNFGSIVDILAPGTNITSSWIGANSPIKILSGTSMATPHVAGVVAQYLSLNPSLNGSTATANVEAKLKGISTKNAITSVPRGTLNYLLFTNF
jgi:subtilisin family serine protease